MRRQFAPAVRAVVVFTVLFGVVYPALVTLIGQGIFAGAAQGSLVRAGDGRVVGSRLIGQQFTSPRYFWPRPSAAGPDGYDATASGASNLGPSNRQLGADLAARVAAYRKANGLGDTVRVPVDAVTASGSGLDPHISVANANLQVSRVAAVRGVSESRVRAVVAAATDRRSFGVFGEDGVNVVAANLALDTLDRIG